MNIGAFEASVLNLLDRVVRRQPLEDSRVELKREWPEPVRAARRLAGHANSLRGEWITWLIGVDEKAFCVPGASPCEQSDWLAALQSHFEGLAPDLHFSLNVPFEGVTVTALLFDTRRIPFVIKNPAGGGLQCEVPWRVGTAVRSARRQDLLLLLEPLRQVPRVEVIAAEVVLRNPTPRPDWNLAVQLYVEPIGTDPLVFPFHRCSALVEIPGAIPSTECEPLRLSGSRASNVEATRSEIILHGPGMLDVGGAFYSDDRDLSRAASASVSVSLLSVGTTIPALIKLQLSRIDSTSPGMPTYRWQGGADAA
jgi:hypothetical protein